MLLTPEAGVAGLDVAWPERASVVAAGAIGGAVVVAAATGGAATPVALA
jgi:hypothetical protein